MPLRPGSIAPDFDLPARRDGRDHVSLGTLTENGPALLAFFKTSCPTCQLSFPVWGELARRYGQKVAVAGVAKDPLEVARPWLDERGFDAPVLDDSDGFGVSGAYGLATVPTLVLVGSGGRVIAASEGWVPRPGQRLGRRPGRALRPVSPGFLSTASDGLPPHKPG